METYNFLHFSCVEAIKRRKTIDKQMCEYYDNLTVWMITSLQEGQDLRCGAIGALRKLG